MSNLRSYTTDRRVFEYWSQGNWIAADRLMGTINSEFRDEPTADGGQGPATADHIGPLSLGFLHRPEFRLLSRAANSAKNNRMTLWDVERLIATEQTGEVVASWHAKQLWNLRKNDVKDEENALRLSKILRDNQRNAIHLLYEIFKEKHLLFLISLLGLKHADYNVIFSNLRIIDFVTKYDELQHTKRETKYAVEQKARRIRIGFEALNTYGTKLNRHSLLTLSSTMSPYLEKALVHLNSVPDDVKILNKELGAALNSESELRIFISTKLDEGLLDNTHFISAHKELKAAMNAVANHLSDLWTDDRYVRAPFDFEVE